MQNCMSSDTRENIKPDTLPSENQAIRTISLNCVSCEKPDF